MSIAKRNLQPELMDDPDLCEADHLLALAGLRRVNWWSRTDAVIWSALQNVEPCRSARDAGNPIRILDIASGGGDLAIRLARRFNAAEQPAEIHGCDISETAVRFASKQAQAASASGVHFFQHDILKDSLPQNSYDVVMCSLFLHHLDEVQAVRLLKIMNSTARRMILVDDLRRTLAGYWLAWLGCRLLSRSRIVHVDGPMSVQGALTTGEARKIAEQAGLTEVVIRTHWPQRFLLAGRKSP